MRFAIKPTIHQSFNENTMEIKVAGGYALYAYTSHQKLSPKDWDWTYVKTYSSQAAAKEAAKEVKEFLDKQTVYFDIHGDE